MNNDIDEEIKKLEYLLSTKLKENERIKKQERGKKEKKISNLKIMDYIIFICLVSVLIFVIISLFLYYYKGIPVSDIKTEFFAFFGAELLGMAGISISNNINRGGNE